MSKLKVVHGEICYLSEEDDQTYGMWCPISFDTNHGFKNGTVFVIENELTALQERIAKLEDKNKALILQAESYLSSVTHKTQTFQRLLEKLKGGEL